MVLTGYFRVFPLMGPREAPRLRSHTVLTKDLGSVLSTHKSPATPAPEDPMTLTSKIPALKST